MWSAFFFALSVIGFLVGGWNLHLHDHVHGMMMFLFSIVFALWAILWKERLP